MRLALSVSANYSLQRQPLLIKRAARYAGIEPLNYGRRTAKIVATTHFVRGSHAQTQFVGYGDEQRHNVGNALAGVSLVVLNGDRPVLFDSQDRCRTVETIALHEILDVRKVLLHLLERRLVLGQQFGAGGRIFGLRNTVFDQSLL